MNHPPTHLDVRPHKPLPQLARQPRDRGADCLETLHHQVRAPHPDRAAAGMAVRQHLAGVLGRHGVEQAGDDGENGRGFLVVVWRWRGRAAGRDGRRRRLLLLLLHHRSTSWVSVWGVSTSEFNFFQKSGQAQQNRE